MIYRAKGGINTRHFPDPLLKKRQTPRILSLAGLQQGALIKAKINSLSADECTSSGLKTKVYTLGKMQKQEESGLRIKEAQCFRRKNDM